MIKIIEKERLIKENYYEIEPKNLTLYIVNEMCESIIRMEVMVLEIYKDVGDNCYYVWCGNLVDRYRVVIDCDTLEPVVDGMYFFDICKAIEEFKIRRKKFINELIEKLDVNNGKNKGELEKKILDRLENQLKNLELYSEMFIKGDN